MNALNPNIILAGRDANDIQAQIQANSANEFALDQARQQAPMQNAIMQQQLRGAEMQVQGAEDQLIGQLLERVEANPDKPNAYRAALRIAQDRGIDISGVPQEYDPEFVQVMRGLVAMPKDQRAETERMIDQLRAVEGDEAARRALRVALKIDPDANAQLRGQTGDKPYSSAGRLRADLDAGRITQEDFDRETTAAPGLRVGKDGRLEIAGNAPLGRSAQNAEQKSLASEMNLLSQLTKVGELAGIGPDGRMQDPSMLTYRGQAEGFIRRQAEKLGISPDEVQRQATFRRTQFITGVQQMFDAYRKEITGAAAAVAELDRLKKSFINMDQSPTEFEAAYAQYSEELKRSMRVRRKLLREGFDLGSEEGGDVMDRTFLSGGDDNPAERFGELVNEVGEDEAYRIMYAEGYM